MSKAAAPRAGWMNKNTLKYGTIAVVVIAIVVSVALMNRVPQAAVTPNTTNASLVVGSKAPDFTITSNAGPFALATMTTPVFVEVFATWCPHCQREVPVVDALAKKYAGKVAFIGISGSPYGVDGTSPENPADIAAWVQRLDVTYPVAFDQDLSTANKFLRDGFPSIVMIDSNKIVRYVGSGEQPAATLQKAIDGTLSSHS